MKIFLIVINKIDGFMTDKNKEQNNNKVKHFNILLNNKEQFIIVGKKGRIMKEDIHNKSISKD